MIQSATPQLLELAGAMRPDWDRDQLTQALAAARNAGWTWARTLLEVARLLCDDKSSAHDLTVTVRDPLARITTPADPQVRAAALAEMRSALAAGDS